MDAVEVIAEETLRAYRHLVGKRIQQGLKETREAGFFGGGTPPFGCKVSDGRVIVDEIEEATVQHIKALRESGFTLQAICDRLHSEGIPAKRSLRWSPKTVSRVLVRAGSK